MGIFSDASSAARASWKQLLSSKTQCAVLALVVLFYVALAFLFVLGAPDATLKRGVVDTVLALLLFAGLCWAGSFAVQLRRGVLQKTLPFLARKSSLWLVIVASFIVGFMLLQSGAVDSSVRLGSGPDHAASD